MQSNNLNATFTKENPMRILSSLALAAALFAPAAFAQTPLPACDGTYAVVRVSEIKPESSMDKFLAAVAAQKAWYAANRPADKIFVSRVMERGASDYSATAAITYHFYGSPNSGEPKHDAAFDAFVKLFSESSTIKTGYLACIPAGMAPAK
jgi:hypothetical protein